MRVRRVNLLSTVVVIKYVPAVGDDKRAMDDYFRLAIPISVECMSFKMAGSP
jgi:Myo-inositol-1-phosphate synthase